jgi:hypothetical protein
MNEMALANRAADWRRLKALVLDSRLHAVGKAGKLAQALLVGWRGKTMLAGAEFYGKFTAYCPCGGP